MSKESEEMRWFRRPHRPHSAHLNLPEMEYWAVPLTPADVTVLVGGFTEEHRLTFVHRPDIGGSDPFGARTRAAAVMRASGLAANAGHATVPLPVTEVPGLANVYSWLQKWAPHASSTEAFGLLEMKLQALSALARANDWRYEYDTDIYACRWVKPVTIDTCRAIEAAH